VLGDRHYAELDPKSDGQKISSNATEGGATRELMRAFELHKKAFHQDSATMHIDLPAPLQRLNIPNRVEEGDLTITKYTRLHSMTAAQRLMISSLNMRSFFHKHVDSVIDLIQSQMAQVEDKRNRVAV
jgi:hypothetical protein